MLKSPNFSALPDDILFRSAFVYSSIGIALVGTDGAWLDVNESVCRITGYPREELLQITFQDITHPDDLEKDLKLLGQMLEGKLEFYEMEKRYFHKNGSVVWILLTVSMVRDEQDKPLFFISQIQDISEKKRLEFNLRQRQNELSSILNQTQIIIARYNRECRHLYVNHHVKEEIGQSADALLGKTFSEIGLDNDSTKLVESCVQRVFSEKTTVLIEIENFITPDKRFYYARFTPEFDSSGNLDTVLCVGFDVTELKKTEFELQLARAQVKQLQAILPICSYCRSIRDDKDFWHTVEHFISKHTDSKLSHSICPGCYDSIVKPELELLRNNRQKISPKNKKT